MSPSTGVPRVSLCNLRGYWGSELRSSCVTSTSPTHPSSYPISWLHASNPSTHSGWGKRIKQFQASLGKNELLEETKGSREMHTCYPSTQLRGRGRKIRSPSHPQSHQVWGQLVQASMHTHMHWSAHTYTHKQVHACAPFCTPQEVLGKKEMHKEEYKTTHNLPPKETTVKTTVHCLSLFSLGEVVYEAGSTFSFQKSFTQAFPKDFNQVKNSICFYIVG